MKIRRKSERVQAGRIFTDRKEPRDAFWNLYELTKKDMDSDDGIAHVLSYYGIGGIGKSSLLHKLMAEMQDKLESPRFACFDFAVSQDSRSALESLRNQLEEKYNYTFPLFDIGLYVYAKKIGEDMEAPRIKTFVERSPSLSCILEVMGAIPTMGIVAQLTKATDIAISGIANRAKKHAIKLAQAEFNDPSELYEQLTCLFADDLADNLKDAHEPMVIMFDTYERLVNEMSSVGEPLTNDLWIRGPEGLIQRVPNVLWVIAGREKLKWERFDKDWNESLETHLLGNLDRNDAEGFLKSAGIADPVLVNGLVDLTDGTPVYLDLCVDRYLSLIERGKEPVIDDFGNDVYSLIERFARYMDDNKKDIVYMLSCLGEWTDEMILQIAPKALPGFSVTTYEKVKDFSFISKLDEVTYGIHQTVGSALNQNCPEFIKSQTKDAALVFCQQKLEQVSVFSSEYIYYVRWLMKYALSKFEDNHKLAEFFVANIRDALYSLSCAGQFTVANSIFYPFLERAQVSGKDFLSAEALSFYSALLYNAGKYRDACEYSSQATELAEHFLEDGDEWIGLEYSRMCQHYSDCLRSLGMFNAACDVDESIYQICKESFGDDDIDTIIAMNNYSRSLGCLGRYKEAYELAEKVLEKYKELYGNNHLDTITAKQNMAVILGHMQRYEDELVLDKEVLKQRTEIFGEDHPDTVTAMQNVSATLGQLDQLEESLQLAEKVLEKRNNILGEKHPDTLTAMLNKAATLGKMECYEEEAALEKEVLKQRTEIFGEDHPDTVTAMFNLAMTLSSLGELDKALKLEQEVLSKRTELLGENHPDTITVMQSLVYLLSDMDKGGEALRLQDTILHKQISLYGENHIDTKDSMNQKASLLLDLERYDEALDLFKVILPLQQKILGDNHQDTLDTIDIMARLLYEMEDYSKAEIYAQKLYDYYTSNPESTDEQLSETQSLLEDIRIESGKH